ncbi:MAG: hypothetical protein D6723_01035 [Acidobacteria bacterium]|nr:MAG: hypothetical protein D6723_01035 [Acidobacteriota bacterium]
MVMDVFASIGKRCLAGMACIRAHVSTQAFSLLIALFMLGIMTPPVQKAGVQQPPPPCDPNQISISAQFTGQDCCWMLTVMNNANLILPTIEATAVGPVTFAGASPASGWVQTPTTGFPVTTVEWTTAGPPAGPLAEICLNPNGAFPQVVNFIFKDVTGAPVCAQQLTFDCPTAQCVDPPDGLVA